jgi:hypothetical protein
MVKLSKSAVMLITASIEMPDYVRLFKSAVMLILRHIQTRSVLMHK